jgi:hypothetical protein
VYALRDSSSGNQVYGFRVDKATGELGALAGFPLAAELGGDPGVEGRFDPDTLTNNLSERMVADWANNRLYVINNGSKTVSAYQIDPATGGLSALPFSPLALGAGQWYCIEVHPSGSPLIIGGSTADGLQGQVTSFAMSSTAASLAPGSPLTTSNSVASTCTLSADGTHFYAANPDILGFSVNATTGTLTPMSGNPFPSDALTPYGLAVDTNGRLFFADGGAVVQDGTIIVAPEELRAFTSGTTIQPVSGNPFTSGISQTISGLWHPAGYYLAMTKVYTIADYLPPARGVNQLRPATTFSGTTFADGAIGVYRVVGQGSATTMNPVGTPVLAGYLERGSSGVGGRGVQAMALDHTGGLIFVTNSGLGTLATFSFDAITGALRGRSQLPRETLGGTGGSLSGLAFVPALPDLTFQLVEASPFSSGATASLTLQVANNGPPSAVTTGEIALVSDLPAGVNYSSATGTGWACSPSNQRLRCSNTTSLAGGTSLPDVRINLQIQAVQVPVFNVQLEYAGEVAIGNNRLTIDPAARSYRLFAPLLRRP